MTAFLSFNLKINVFQKLTKNFSDCSTLSELKISDLKFYSSKMLVFLMSKLIVNVYYTFCRCYFLTKTIVDVDNKKIMEKKN